MARHSNLARLALLALTLCGIHAIHGAEKSTSSEGSTNSTNRYFAAGKFKVESIGGLVLRDEKRAKDLQIRVTHPVSEGPFPVIVWCHGAYGSRDNYQPIARHWASHGYVVIQANHSDSFALGMRPGNPDAFKDWQSRPKDVAFMLDSLDEIEKLVPAIKGKTDRKRIGVGGHSYGAHTAQLVGGVTTRGFGTTNRTSYADKRVKAVIILSGQGTGEMLDTNSWQALKLPALVVTGSEDNSGRTGKPYSWRLEPYQYSSPGDKYLLFIEGAHHGFGGIAGPTRGAGAGPANPAQVEWVNATAVAFWDAYLREDKNALSFLKGDELKKRSDGKAKLTNKLPSEETKGKKE